MSEVKTVQGALVSEIRKSSAFNPYTQVAPACILWTDKERQWEVVISSLQGAMSELFVLGEFDLEKHSDCAIWLKCVWHLMHYISYIMYATYSEKYKCRWYYLYSPCKSLI